ncbi:MerR family transcriptional regulator [Microbacterium sp. P02]|uniref:MerR family transcriptional regulator n=1 Tax=Microbacterium sp. P02 TaxID=3366260 RepID=UPI00367034EC
MRSATAVPAERSRGVYGIAVAAEIVGVGVQTLRLYESKGLFEPHRTPGGTRRYSEDDLDLLRRVIELVAEGVNIAGARRILRLEADNAQLRSQLRSGHEEVRGRG